MTDGVRASAQPWMALIITNEGFLGLNEEPNCSGTLVADGWVLTAAHCVTSSGRTVSPTSIRVLIGRDDRDARNKGAAYGVARIVRMPGFTDLVKNDAALIHLENFETDRWRALPLAFEASVVNRPGGATLYGYGATGWKGERPTGFGRLWKSPDGAFVRAPECDGGLICFKRTSEPRVMRGDSGGPWLRWVAGGWQLIAVQAVVRDLRPSGKSDPARATSTLARLADGRTMLEWVRDTAAIPTPPAGTIVRDPATQEAWLIGEDRYRRWIPTASIYRCLTGSGHRVVNLPKISIDTIADRVGTNAKCGNKQAGDRLVFVSSRDGNSEIYVMDADGRNVSRLTRHPGRDTEPQTSPDGRRIAFERRFPVDAYGEIFVMNADGSGVANLSRHTDEDEAADMAWSPDSRFLAFMSYRDGRAELYVAGANGSGLRNLTRDAAGSDGSPDWSPDGRWIAFNSLRDGPHSEVRVIGADGRGLRRLTFGHDDWDPHWSPDGRRLIFTRHDGKMPGLYIIDADGKNLRRLTHSTGDYPEDWSPDGGTLLFWRAKGHDVWVIGVDGRGLRNLSHHRADDFSASWSPDGRQIAFHSDRTGKLEIYLIGRDGSGLHRLTRTPGRAASLSPTWLTTR